MVVKSYLQDTNFFQGLLPQQLLAKYGSPLYVYNESLFRRRCREMQNLLEGVSFRASYSIKANSNLTLLRIARSENLYADAMSKGEILALEKAGFSREQIFFVPNNIDREEMSFALERGLLISCDSLDQVELLGSLKRGSSLAVRVNPGVGAGHHEKVVTAGANTKFGIDSSKFGQLRALLKDYDLKLYGVNQHIGSLFMEPEPYLEAAANFLQLIKEFENLHLIDFGGGFGIPYKKLQEQPRLALDKLGRELSLLAQSFAADYGKPLLFKTEPGRYIAAEAGVLIGQVTALKENSGVDYVGTNLGFNVLSRPVIYDSWHDLEIWRDDLPLTTAGKLQTVVGNICESGDILAKQRYLPPAQKGDLLIVLDAGAYGYAMSSNYNNRLRPAEILITADGQDRLIRRRDSYEDLFRGFEL